METTGGDLLKDLKSRWFFIFRNKIKKQARHSLKAQAATEKASPVEASADEDFCAAAPSPVPSVRSQSAASRFTSFLPSRFRRSQESVISLMSSTSTSGLGHSQSPLLTRNYHRGSNRRFSHQSGCPPSSAQAAAAAAAAASSSSSNGYHGNQCSSYAGSSSHSSMGDFNFVRNSSPRLSATSLNFHRKQLIQQQQQQQHKHQGIACSAVVHHQNPSVVKSHVPDLPLKPQPFEVPCISEYEPFIGREWIYHELYEILVKPQTYNGMRGAVIYGDVGTGKTAVLYNLVRESRSEYVNISQQRKRFEPVSAVQAGTGSNRFHQQQQQNQSQNQNWRQMTSEHVIAYHFCQIDSKRLCNLAELLLNLILSVAYHRHFESYRELLLSHIDRLNVKEFLKDPMTSFRQLFTDMLSELRKSGKAPSDESYLILIDSLDEAEYHRPEFGDSVASFLLKNAECLFPDWCKLVLTIKTSHLDLLKGLHLHKINLDNTIMDERVYSDTVEYVKMRINDKSSIRKNVQVTVGSSKIPSSTVATHSSYSFESGASSTTISSSSSPVSTISSAATAVTGGTGAAATAAGPLNRFADHFVSIAKGNFLYMKLTLNLIERNYLVMKGANYKVLPVNLAETFLLMFNLKFPTLKAYEKLRNIFNVVLASLYPLTARQIFEAVNSQFVDEFVKWEEFCERLSTLQEYFAQKRDDTYVLFHPAFREWLVHREDGQSPKFLCDLRQGHALLALSMCRQPQPGELLNADQLQELGHHVLKAHLYKRVKLSGGQFANGRDCQLYWVNLRAEDIRRGLCTDQNIYSPNTKVSRLLLLAGADPDAKDDQGSPLLCVASRTGRNEFAALLLEFGADVCRCDQKGLSPLMHAAQAGNLDAVQLLHQHGAKLSQVDGAQRCALVHAALAGYVDVVSFFLHCDWSESEEYNDESTATTRHDSGNGTSSSQAMDAAQYSSALKQQAIQQALVAAAEAGQLQVCRFLCELGDVIIDDPCPVTNETAFSVACLNCHTETATYLVNNRAKLSYDGDQKFISPLIRAVQGGCWEIVSLLLTKGVNVNEEKNEKRETPLIKVAQIGHTGILELLLSRGAKLDCTDVDGRTAFCWACINNRNACASLLVERGAKLHTVDKYGRAPVHYAAESGNKQLIQLLLDSAPNNANLFMDLCDSTNRRPLEIAIESENLEAVQKFLRKGAKLIPATWQSAKCKSNIILILLNKLFDDGRILYRKNQIQDAVHRFKYALKKLESHLQDPKFDQSNSTSTSITRSPDHQQTFLAEFRRLKYHLHLNVARCKRKAGDLEGAVVTCSDAVNFDADQSEAYFCRARCLYELHRLEPAQRDLIRVLKMKSSGQQMGCSAGSASNSAFYKEATELMIKINDQLLHQEDQQNSRSSSNSNNNNNKRVSFNITINDNTNSANDSLTDNSKSTTTTVADFMEEYDDHGDKRRKNWEQGSSDSGNMPDIESVKI